MMNTRCKHSTDMTATVTVLSQPFNSTMSWCRSRVICSQILLERILFLWVTGHFCSNEHFRTMLLFLIHFGVHSKNRGFHTEFNCCCRSFRRVMNFLYCTLSQRVMRHICYWEMTIYRPMRKILKSMWLMSGWKIIRTVQHKLTWIFLISLHGSHHFFSSWHYLIISSLLFLHMRC